MTNTQTWTVRNVRLERIVPWAIVTATICFAAMADQAHAAGTAAGTTISNTATATYNDPSGNPQTTPSNTVDLVVEEGRCCGAVVLDESSSKQFIIPAKAVVLSTGGAGQIYARTTNPPNATGDGMAMAT